MSIPLQNARLCLDCDTVFEEPRCPSCSSESYFPLSRWVRPAVQSETVTVRKKARKTSLMLLGGGAAFALWKLLSKADHNLPKQPEEKVSPQRRPGTGTEAPHQPRVRKRKPSGGPDAEA